MNEPILLILNDASVWNARDQNGEFIEPARERSSGVGGDHQRGAPNIVICVTDVTDWEEVLSRPQVFQTTYEKVKGFTQQVVIDGIPQWEDPEETIPTMETIQPEQPDKARYDAVYTPAHVNELMGIPGGYKVDHLLP